MRPSKLLLPPLLLRLLLLLLLLLQWRCGGAAAGVDGNASSYEDGASFTSAKLSNAIRKLIDKYDNRLRPNFGTRVLSIGIEVVIASFDSISEVNMDYTITMYLNQYWADSRLAFDAANANKSMTLTGEFASKIWVPDTFLANDKHSFLHDVTEQNKMVRLYGDGSIIYGMRFTTTLACMMDLHYYPLDVQNCTVEIESYGYPTEDVTMQWKNGQMAVDGADKVKMPQFSLEHFAVSTTTIKLSTGTYQRLSLIFRLRRNVGFFVFQTYLPSILIVMLSWVSFWINHEATSARVALGITTVLTMTTISTGVRSSLPRISYVKAIDIYLVMCFVFVFAALLEYAMVNYTYWGARAKRKAKRFKEAAGGGGVGGGGGGGGGETMFNERSSLSPALTAAMRMSPILGLRHRSGGGGGGGCGGGGDSTNADDTDEDNDVTCGSGRVPVYPMSPHVPYISRTTSTATALAGSGRHGQLRHRRVSMLQRRQRMLSSLRQRAKDVKQNMPRIKDVNKIDKYSRLAFPSLFILFNLCYWCFYLLTG